MTAAATFKPTQRKQILALLEKIGGDGHGVYDPMLLSEFPVALQKRFTRIIKSDTSSYKSTLFDSSGNVIKQIKAFYALTVQECICADLGIEAGSYNGRGFQAQACASAISKFFGQD